MVSGDLLDELEEGPRGFRRLLCDTHTTPGSDLVVLAEISHLGEPELMTMQAGLWRRMGAPRFLRVELTARDELADRAADGGRRG